MVAKARAALTPAHCINPHPLDARGGPRVGTLPLWLEETGRPLPELPVRKASQLYILLEGGELVEQRIRTTPERFAAVLRDRPGAWAAR